MLTDRQGVEISGVQSHNGATFFYCVVGSVQIFAVYLYLDEIGKSCVGRKGQPVCAALLPAAVGSGDNNRRLYRLLRFLVFDQQFKRLGCIAGYIQRQRESDGSRRITAGRSAALDAGSRSVIPLGQRNRQSSA